ncbi:hypothetical protein AV530_001983 [Patagioenas fasciata monilis]|uniref:Uncharacterized protein n=1 Tax=Patagioenas fasciata monilis TaxID=372326 RepID=A0A1V4J6T7_PATFA|nr:hypothetical protein AV530_001983 [Patagioenas fasciata monilis]
MLIVWGEYAVIYLTVGRSNLRALEIPEVRCSAGSPAPQSSLPVPPADELTMKERGDLRQQRGLQLKAWGI